MQEFLKYMANLNTKNYKKKKITTSLEVLGKSKVDTIL